MELLIVGAFILVVAGKVMLIHWLDNQPIRRRLRR